jgi:hypothetical protein
MLDPQWLETPGEEQLDAQQVVAFQQARLKDTV